MMKEITAFRCSDGVLYSDEDKAEAHEVELLGQELDGLLRLFELDISRVQECRGVMCAMKKHHDLLNAAKLIIAILGD
jgi:hypothetical protein